MGVKVVKSLPKYANSIKGSLKPAMPLIANYLQSSADKKIRNGVKPENAPLTKEVKKGNKTLRDNGTLAASIAPHHGDSWADASTNVKHARILQEGGTIRSKGKGLWIPASSKTRTLMRQYGATSPGKLINAMKGSGYSFYRRGKAFIAKKGAKGAPFVLFIIKQQVKIPSRPFLYIDDKDEKFIMKHVTQAVENGLKEAK